MLEDVIRRNPRRSGTPRAFGFSLGLLWALVGGTALLSSKPWLSGAALTISVALVLAAFLAPRLLGPVQAAWDRIGLGLARVVNPVVLAVLFFGVLCPFAWLRRLRVRDPLELARDASAPSYWRPCQSARPSAESMRHVF